MNVIHKKPQKNEAINPIYFSVDFFANIYITFLILLITSVTLHWHNNIEIEICCLFLFEFKSDFRKKVFLFIR